MSRKIILILSLSFVFILGCQNKTKEQQLKDGIQLMKNGNARGAVVLFKKALDKDQNYFEARTGLARAYVAIGKYEQAEKEYLKVLRQDPSRVEVHLEMGALYVLYDKPDKAISEAEVYLQSKHDDPKALGILGSAYARLGKFAEAEQYIMKAISIEPNNNSAKLSLASVHMAKGDKEGTKALLDEIIKTDGKDTRAYYALAELEISLNKKDTAIQVYKKISEIKPDDSNAPYKSGILYIEKGELDNAEKIADDLLKRFPKRPEAHVLKGLVFYHKKNFDGAVIELQKALAIKPLLGSYYFLGLSHYARGELEQSLSQLQRAVDINPYFVQARLLISIILLTQKRVDDSITEVKRVLQLDGKNALAHNILGGALMKKGMLDEAMVEFNEAIEINPKLIDAHLKKGVIDLGKGKVKEAEAELKTAVKISPELINTRLLLFSYYVRQKDYDSALKTLKEGISGNKTDALLYNNIATVLFEQNKPADAIKYLQKAKEVNPGYPTPYFNLATYYAAIGDYDKALDQYRELLKKDNRNLQALLRMASVLELKGKNDEAFQYYKMAKDTKRSPGYLALANYFVRKKQFDKAIDVLDEAIKLNPRDVGAIEFKGKIYESKKDYKKAIKIYEEIEAINPEAGLKLIVAAHIVNRDYKSALKKLEQKLKTNPDRLDVMADVSKIYGYMGEPYKAIENARKIINQKPGSAYGYIVLSSMYAGQHDLNKAIETLKQGVRVDEKNLNARQMLGDFYTNKKEYALALSTYDGIIRNNPRYLPAIFAQGTVYDVTDKKKEALKKYRDVIAQSENYIPALNNIAYLCASGYGSKEEALRLAMKAYRLSPNSASVMDTLGYALLQNGRKDDASKVLEKAVALLPDNPSVNYHLALALKETGNTEKAKSYLMKAVAKGSFPESEKANKLLQVLKK